SAFRRQSQAVSGGLLGPTRVKALTGADATTARQPAASSSKGSAAQADSTIVNFQLCATWRVQFVDAGFGEDYWATSSWQDVPARYAFGLITHQTDGSIIWQGNLDGNGCVGVSGVLGDPYEFQQWTIQTIRDDVEFDTYFMSNGTEFFYVLYSDY